MAVWQVEFAIVPRRALATKERVQIADLLNTDWWSSEHLPPGYAQHIGAIAPAGSSWTAELQTWGREDENRVDVWFKNGKAVRMVARVDVRRLDARFGAMLTSFGTTPIPEVLIKTPSPLPRSPFAKGRPACRFSALRSLRLAS